MAYGVLPTGFARKPLSVLLDEINTKAREVFGEDVIVSPESPMGQLNGLYASLATTLWETAESTYQSYDPDQAEGVRLEQLARIRLLERSDGEADADFRQAITNAGRARIDLADITRAVVEIDGVSYAQVFVNSTDTTNADGQPGHSVAVAVLGGSTTLIATAIRAYVVPGVDTYGNVAADITLDGYCRTISFIRPVAVPLGLSVTVSSEPDRLGCPPPSAASISLAFAAALTGASRPINGRDVDLHMIRTALATVYPNVEVLAASVFTPPNGSLQSLPKAISFMQIAEFDPAYIAVDFA